MGWSDYKGQKGFSSDIYVKVKTPDGKDNTDVINRMDFKEKNRVTPKQGRAIVFDGHHWHTSGQPKDMGGLRIIMNYNLV